MNVARVILALVFCTFFTASYFTNKYVLSVLKFTFPTIFQGWQTSTGALLLLVTWKLGWVEINAFSRSAVFSQLPGCFLFIGNIYAGSKALSLLVSAKIICLNMDFSVFLMVGLNVQPLFTVTFFIFYSVVKACFHRYMLNQK
uniref:Transmembrane protein 241 n=1 Tax=Sinocyclocheilus rhinocerous TaxID=307959 RepID=A0A673LZR3_9TELE